jgi:sulfonate transport system permease protein
MTVTPIEPSASLRAGFFPSLARSPRPQIALVQVLAAAGGIIRPGAVALAVPLFVLAAWSLAARYERVAPQILPAPSIVAATARELIETGQLQAELSVSLLRLGAGLLLGAGAGLAIGLTMGLSRSAEAYLAPTVRAVWLVPSLGWLPFFMLIFGIGETLKIVLIAKACFLPMMVNSFDGVRSIPRGYREVARTLALGPLDTVRFVLLPAMVPSILNGFRLALSKGWQVLVLVEMIASAAGIGYLMTWGRKSFQLDVVLVTMAVIGLTGWALDRAALAMQRKAASWSAA